MRGFNRCRGRHAGCSFLFVLFVYLMMAAFSAEAWVAAPVSTCGVARPSTTQLRFFGGAPPDDGSPGDYACKDCEFVFTKGPQAWAALPDNYSCPLCGAPKRRFTKLPKGSGKAKAKKASTAEPAKKKGWF